MKCCPRCGRETDEELLEGDICEACEEAEVATKKKEASNSSTWLTREEEKALAARMIAGDEKAWDEFRKKFSKLISDQIRGALKTQSKNMHKTRTEAMIKTHEKGRFHKDVPDEASYHENSYFVEELQQEVLKFLRENDCKELRCWHGECSLAGTWLYLIARTVVKKHYSTREIRLGEEFVSLDKPLYDKKGKSFSLHDKSPDRAPSPRDMAIFNEYREILAEELKKLPPFEFMLYELIVNDKKTPEDIVLDLNLPSVAAYYEQKSRLLDKLQKACKKRL